MINEKLEEKIGANNACQESIVSILKLRAIEEERYYVFDKNYDISEEIIKSKESKVWHFAHTVEQIIDTPFVDFLIERGIEVETPSDYTKFSDFDYIKNNMIIEEIWEALVDVTHDVNGNINSKYYIWDAGTSLDEIRVWFSLHHTGGLNYLTNVFE